MLCFSYGSNMSQRRLQARVPSARFMAVAELPGHRLRFHKSASDGSAKCNAEDTGNPEDRVIGVVYEIAATEKPDLDRHEALGFGYDEKQVVLKTEKGYPARLDVLRHQNQQLVKTLPLVQGPRAHRRTGKRPAGGLYCAH